MTWKTNNTISFSKTIPLLPILPWSSIHSDVGHDLVLVNVVLTSFHFSSPVGQSCIPYLRSIPRTSAFRTLNYKTNVCFNEFKFEVWIDRLEKLTSLVGVMVLLGSCGHVICWHLSNTKCFWAYSLNCIIHTYKSKLWGLMTILIAIRFTLGLP